MNRAQGRRSMLLGGLRMVLKHPGAVFWTYLFNLVLALVFSLSLHDRVASVLDHSLAAERLNGAFDLGTLGALTIKLTQRVPASGAFPHAGVLLYFLVYFLLVPGALFSYRVDAPQRLSILLSSGLNFFWRFVRITLLTALISAAVLVPLFLLQNAWMEHVDDRVVGVSAVWHDVAGWLVIALVAALLRVYFDLVEVYTVQLDDLYRESGKPDRRVRKVLIPAFKMLRANFARVYGSFWLTALVGLAAMAFAAVVSVGMLAQPRVWPAFLLLQGAFLVSLFTRYWMRAAETALACDFPLPGASSADRWNGGTKFDSRPVPYEELRPVKAYAAPVPAAVDSATLNPQPQNPIPQPIPHPILDTLPDPIPGPEPAPPSEE